MHVHFLDPYHPTGSILHRMDSRIKLVLVVAYILTCSLTPFGAWPVYVLLFTLILSAILLSELGLRFVWLRAAIAIPFALAALPVIFTTGGSKLAELHIAGFTLVPTLEGAARFVSIAIKSWLSVQAAILLASTTPYPGLLQGMRVLGVPPLLVSTFGLMWRYLFVLVDEAVRLMRARSARSGVNRGGPSVSRTGGPLTWRARVAGGMAGNLFLRGLERSERIYVAMLSRGYDGEMRAIPMPPLTANDRLVLLLAGLAFASLLALGILFWG